MSKSFIKILILFLISTLITENLFAQEMPDRLTFDSGKNHSTELISLLKEPLNLRDFKIRKQEKSNNGGYPARDYFYKPPYKGFYYHYLIFKGYREDGPRIVNYKKGEEIGGYLDSTEILIQLSCNRPDKDLLTADLLSKDDESIIKRFGDNFIKKKHFYVWQYSNTLLIVKTGKERWFKILKLNKPILSFTDLEANKHLLKFG